MPLRGPAITTQQLRARALEYRQMAASSRMAWSSQALLRLAARFDALAAEEELAMRPSMPVSIAAGAPEAA